MLVGIFGASVFCFMDSGSALRLKGWLSNVAVPALFGYLYQWFMQMNIFRCSACGATQSTYRVA
jgi:hypothetical protein